VGGLNLPGNVVSDLKGLEATQRLTTNPLLVSAAGTGVPCP
jgi:hypothetical protein